MKALKRIQSFTILGLFLVFTSCSLLTGKDGANTRVTLRIGSDLYHRLSSRAAEITDSEEGGGFEIDVEIKGDYSEKKSATISENGAQIVFTDIPEGSTIYAQGKIFKTAYGRKIMLYNGKSEEITIEEGDGNFLELLLKKTKVTLIFDTDGGSEIASQTIFVQETALEPEITPEKTGYTFLGWFASKSDKDFFDFSTPIVEDTLLLAKWVKNENVFIPTSNTEFYDYSLSASDTYLLRLNGYNYSNTSYGAALKGYIKTSNISATLYVDIVGTNKSTGDNHGGFKFEPSPTNSISDSSVDVIFFTSSTGSFEVGRRTDNGVNYQMDYQQNGLTATYSFMNNCTVSSMKFGETECSTAEEFFTNAKSVNSGESKHSYFTITKN